MKRDAIDFSDRGFLIVDDKPFIRSLIQSFLIKCMVKKIRHAGSGEEAVGMLSTHSAEIDCVICDWNMEPINGLELLKMIRAGSIANTRPDLHFVMLTGHGDSDVVTTAVALDVHGYLLKPVSIEGVINGVERAFARKLILKSADEYLAIPLVTSLKNVDSSKDHASPWILWPRAREQRQEMARKIVQIRKEAVGQLKRQATDGEKRVVVNPRKVRLSDVVSGSVLAEDLLTTDGTLLIGAGTVITPSLLTRLREVAPANDATNFLTIGQFQVP